MEEARNKFQTESEEYHNELAQIRDELTEIGSKGRYAFMEIDWSRVGELERRHKYLLSGGKEEA